MSIIGFSLRSNVVSSVNSNRSLMSVMLLLERSKVVNWGAYSNPVKSLIVLAEATSDIRLYSRCISILAPGAKPKALRTADAKPASTNAMVRFITISVFAVRNASGSVSVILFPDKFSVCRFTNPASGSTSVMLFCLSLKSVSFVKPDRGLTSLIELLSRYKNKSSVKPDRGLTSLIELSLRVKTVSPVIPDRWLMSLISLSASPN